MKNRILAAALLALPAVAQAQGPWCGYGWGWVDGYGQGRVVTYNDNIPYFSAHPPVYYSLDIVRRPMGPSPFAYPGYYAPMTMEVEVAAPMMMTKAMEPTMINNQYFLAKKEGAAIRKASHVVPLNRQAAAAGAQLIVNPFVKR
jgi:hypothetical protein